MVYEGGSMNKRNLLCALLIGASALAVPPNYLAQYKRFKTTLAGYKQCILRKRACTPQEKKSLGAVVATLVTFAAALGGALGYKWYQEQMALSWDGIKQMVDAFDADVRSQFPTGKVVPFDMTALEEFQRAIAKKPLIDAEQARMKADIDVMVPGVGGKQGTLQLLIAFTQQQSKPTYESLRDTFTENLTDFPLVDPQKVYDFLDLSETEGMAQSAMQMKAIIAQKITDSKLKRQLDYMFANDMQKQLYDAYLQGSQAVEALPETPAQIESQMTFITELITALSVLVQK